MRIDPIIFKDEKELYKYESNLALFDCNLKSELEGGRILATFAFNVVGDFKWATGDPTKKSESEGYRKAFDLVAQVHSAALSSYLASGGQLKEM